MSDIQNVFNIIFKDDNIIIVMVTHPYHTLNNYGRIIYSTNTYTIYLFDRGAENAEFAFPSDDIQLAFSPYLGEIVYQDVF